MKFFEVKDAASKAGLVAVEQRGFYSHFARIRTVDYQTIGCVDFVGDEVPDIEVEELIELGRK